jgi:ribose 5-phosphate isomerase B
MIDNGNGRGVAIAIGCDHAGFCLKESLVEDLKACGYDVQDYGAFSTDSVDYPDIARAVAEAIASGQFGNGILICGTGIGMSIAANKIKGIRAAACSEPYSARMAKLHNDANIICMGSRVVGQGLALEIAEAFLDTQFEGGRHKRRVDKINEM